MRMSSRHTLGLLTASVLLLGSPGAPVVAADDPEAAVAALFEAVAARSLADLDGLVCEGQQDAVRDAFGDAALGIDLMAQTFDSMAVSIDETAVVLLHADDTTASARVTGTLGIDVDDEQLREFVREIIEAGAGPDDPPISADDIGQMVPLAADALGLHQPIDTEVSLVLEGDGWVVCGGFDSGVQGNDGRNGADPIVSSDGLCALATPTELSQLSSLEYDSSTGYNEFCTYSQSDWDGYHASTIGIIFDSTLDEWRDAFVPDGELEIAGTAAFSSGSDVFAQAGADVLQVQVSLPEMAPGDVDAATQAVRISELFLPRVGDFVINAAEPQPTAEPALGPTLCEGMSLLDLNLTSGRAFDDAEGDAWFCVWSSADAEIGLDTVVATVSDLTLDEFRELLGDTIEVEIEGQPALTTPGQVVVELADGRTLDVSVSYGEGTAPGMPADLLATAMAARLLGGVPAEPTASVTPALGEGLLAGQDRVDDLCTVVSHEELAAISGVPFEDPGFGADYCEYYGGNADSGWHYALTSLEHRSISLWMEDFPEGVSIEIDGQPALLVEDALPDLDASAVAIVLVPGFEELTFAAGVGIDTSTGTQVDVAAVATIMAEQGLGRLVGSGD